MKKNVQLKKLELTNYRNIDFASYEFNGNSKIVGDNRIGKTNTLEAIYFLLTGYLLNGSSDIQAIKPLNNQKAVVVVSGTFDVDGKTITLCKKFGEEWVKQRNTGVEVMKGHFTELYYNGIKQSTVRDYENMFNEDFGIEPQDTIKICLTQMLTNPFFIGDMCESKDWQEVRKLIIALVGDVKDEDVFVKEPMTAILRNELELANGRLDQVKLKLTNEVKGLEETLIADGAKIEVLSKVETPNDTDVSFAKDKIKSIDENIASLRSSVGTSQAQIDLKNKIADLNVKIAEEKTLASRSGENSALTEISKKRNNAFDEKAEIQRKISECNYKIDNVKSKIEKLEAEKHELADQYYELKNAEIKVETICPTCKRPLDASQIEKARNELIENNKTKLEIVVVDGKKKVAEIKEATETLTTLNDEKAKLEKLLDEVSNRISSINEEYNNVLSSNTAPTNNAEIERLNAEKSQLESELSTLQNNEDEARKQINSKIYELEQSKVAHQKVLDDYAYSVRQKEEKEKCEKEQTEHNKALVQKEQMLDMVKKFTFTKLQMLDNNVSKVFGNIKFQLIKENINGGFDTVCKPYIYDPIAKASTDTLWRSGSKSERVATGIAIVEAIKNSLGLPNMPFLFDEGGELSTDTINTRLQTESQIICVKVQDNIVKPMVLSL